MIKLAFAVLALAAYASNSWADCTSDASQVISKLKQFDSRVSEQSHATVKVKKEDPPQTVSLSDLLAIVKRACVSSSSSASLIVVNPQDNKPITINFSKSGGQVIATTNGKSTRVSL